jgi:hypothetical protein
VIRPVFVAVGTVAVICVLLTTLNTALLFLNTTEVAPAKPVPLIVTSVPIGPLVGLNPEIVGPGTTTAKLPELVAVPSGVVTLTAPLVAPAGTVALSCVPLMTVNAAAVPLNATVVAPPRFEPLIVTAAPTEPLVGEKLVIDGVAGAAVTSNVSAELAVPPEVVTPIVPVVALAGTVAVICEAPLTV